MWFIIISCIFVKIKIKIQRVIFLIVSAIRSIVADFDHGVFYRLLELTRILCQIIIILCLVYKAEVNGINLVLTFFLTKARKQTIPVKLNTHQGTFVRTSGIQLPHLSTRCSYIYTYVVDIHISTIGRRAVVVYLKYVRVIVSIRVYNKREIHLHPFICIAAGTRHATFKIVCTAHLTGRLAIDRLIHCPQDWVCLHTHNREKHVCISHRGIPTRTLKPGCDKQL